MKINKELGSSEEEENVPALSVNIKNRTFTPKEIKTITSLYNQIHTLMNKLTVVLEGNKPPEFELNLEDPLGLSPQHLQEDVLRTFSHAPYAYILFREGIRTFGDLLCASEESIKKVPGIGITKVEKIKDVLKSQFGIDFPLTEIEVDRIQKIQED